MTGVDPPPAISRRTRTSTRRSSPYASGRLAVDAAPFAVLGGVRQPRRPGDRVPARRAGRRLPAASPPLLRSRALAHRALRPARRRTLEPDGERGRQHDAGRWSPTSRSCAACSALERMVALRRIVGLDARARLCADASAALRGARCCAASSSRPQREIDWFMHGMGRIFPEARARVRRLPPAGRAHRPARELPPPPRRPRSCRAPARGATPGTATRRACSTLLPRAESPLARRRRRRRAGDRAHRGALLRAPRLPRRRPAGRQPRAHPPPPLHDRARAATTSSARSRRRDALARAWPEAEFVSCPTPATRCASPASRASSWPPWSG